MRIVGRLIYCAAPRVVPKVKQVEGANAHEYVCRSG